MGPAVIEAVVGLLPWILAWFALGGNSESVQKNIEGFGSAITEGPVKTATNAWIEVAAIAAGLGFVVWIAESKTAKHLGQEVGAPPVESIHIATPPTFGSSSSYTAGPISGGVSTNMGSGGSVAAGNPGRKIRSVKTTRTTTTKRSAFGRKAA